LSTRLQLTGPGVFAAEARITIEREATRLAALSAAMIATLLLVVYRSLPLLLLGLLPVVSGALAGVAAVALGFGVVHGITLGFGVTLIGEAVDYSIYLFMQSRRAGAGWTRTLWPTMRLGLLTSVCGFASLLPSGFPGLAQLGLYSITGLIAAGLTTRYVLPQLMRADYTLASAAPLGRRVSALLQRLRPLRVGLWLIPPLAAVALYAHRDGMWNRELAALSPVPQAALILDGELRADLGAPDTRSIIVLAGADEQAVLRAAEAHGAVLDTLVTRGVIAGFQSPARYLPSVATQQARQAALPDGPELQRRLLAAARDLPVRVERLQPFLADVERARIAVPLRHEDLAATSLGAGLDALLVRHDGRWHALLPLQALAAPGGGSVDVGAVEQAVHDIPTPGVEVAVLDLKRESDALYAGYLGEALRLSLAGFGAIVVLLLVALRSVVRTARVVAPLVLAVLTVLLGFALAGRPLNILHLIGLLLVIAVGSNYALFFARGPAADPDDAGAQRMLASLLVANLTTVLAFGVLAFSSVPVLSALGTTVAPGAFLALLFAALLANPAKSPARAV
jgi:predicted exporter